MISLRVKFDLPYDPPKVGVLICSANKDNILFKCLRSLSNNTFYPNYQIYLCINSNIAHDLKAMMPDVFSNSIIVERQENESYSYSVFANRLVKACQEDIICLYNDDIEPIADTWLLEMLPIAVQSHVGVVGAKLLFPDSRIQHVGCVSGIGGICAHIYKESPENTQGYHSRCSIINNLSIVTGACSLMRKSVYNAVDGYDETLAAFNDVDFCMKLIKKGFYNVYNPYAVMRHQESFTRGYDNTDEKKLIFDNDCRIMKERWGEYLLQDPFYNPNLSLESITYEVAKESRYKKPWVI